MLDDVQKTLGGLGFEKRTQGVLTLAVAPDLLGWIGMNQATRDRGNVIELNLAVGVRHQPTEKLVAALRSTPYNEYSPPTISIHIGYLMPDRKYHPWLLSVSGSDVSQATSVAKAVQERGIPFMTRNNTLGQILDSIANTPALRDPELHQYRLPVMRYLSNDYSGAEDLIQKRLTEIEDRHDQAAELFQRFAAALRRRMRN
jgi:hypothetical protein